METNLSITSEVLRSEYFKTVRICKKHYTIKAPWTETVARALGKLSGISVPDEATDLSIISYIPVMAPKVAAFIAVLCVGNVNRWGTIEEWKFRRAFKNAMCTTESEKLEIMAECMKLISGSDFFEYASWGKKLANEMAKEKQ